MKLNIYNGGPLFSEYEAIQRRIEGEKIKQLLNKNNIEFELFNPVDFDVNPKEGVKTQPTPSKIYEYDENFINISNVFFFDLYNEDHGTLVELGMVFQKLWNKENIKLYVVNSDFRVNSNSRFGFESTVGFNSFVTGGIYSNNLKIHNSFDSALEQFKNDFKIS